MRVFILSTGRSGTLAFARACKNINNYTAGHETRARILGKERFAYPDQHIEADSRLVWFLGALDLHFGKDAFYVHLVRGREATVKSYNRRWVRYGSIIKAYCEGIHQITLHKLDRQKRLEVVNDFYDNVHENIRHFLKDKEKVLTIQLEQIEDEFPVFWKQIGAEGDLEKAMETFKTRHHRSKTGWHKGFVHEMKFRIMRMRRRIF